LISQVSSSGDALSSGFIFSTSLRMMEMLSGFQLFGLTSTNFAYGFMIATQGLLLAPLEAERLFPKHSAIAMAAFAMATGLTQVVGPAAGRWSDLSRAAEGKRLPCVLKAAAATFMLTAMLPVASALEMGGVFMVFFFLQQLAWNVLQVVQLGLVPDLAMAEQRGTAGGLTAALTLAGAFAGLFSVRFITGEHGDEAQGTVDYIHYYIGMGLTLTCCVIVVLTSMTEKVEQNRQHLFTARSGTDEQTNLLDQLHDCYKFDRDRYPEFAKLLMSKMCYSANVIVKGFLLFFVQDTFRLRSEAGSQVLVGDSAIAAEATAVLAAALAITFLGGRTSQATGSQEEQGDVEFTFKARQAALYGTAWMALLWLGPPAVGYGVLRETHDTLHSHTEIAQRWEKWMVAGTAVWGLGQGLYLAGDQALGYALLPDRNEASRYLGITGVWSSIGAVLGGAICGGLLFTFGSLFQLPPSDTAGPGYGYPGYLALFIFAVCVNAWACRIVSSIVLDGGLCETTRILKGVP